MANTTFKGPVTSLNGFIDSSKLWLTYEETIDANTSQRPLQTEEKSRDRVGGASA